MFPCCFGGILGSNVRALIVSAPRLEQARASGLMPLFYAHATAKPVSEIT